jgi:hypothetical protein
MKHRANRVFFSALQLMFMTACSIFFVSCSKWVIPRELVGTWSATQVVTVRYNTGIMSFRFVKDTVTIAMSIQENGSILGTLGGAKFENCTVSANRGWFGRMFNLNTDYIITGNLAGRIFAQDTLSAKEISAPFNVVRDTLRGGIFHTQGMDAFPMVTLRLSRQS